MQGIEIINSLTTYAVSGNRSETRKPDSFSEGSTENTGKVEKQAVHQPDADQNVDKFVPVEKTEDSGQLEEAARKISSTLSKLNINIKFGVDAETGKQFFQLVDSVENKVIKQIPSEEVIELSKKLDELQGTMLNTLA